MLSYLYNLATDRYKGKAATLAKFFLYLASFLYGLVARLLIFIYRLRPHRLNCKVISVGNITLGGTGKTSLVALIAGYLRQEGHKVAILSRGYKRRVRSYEMIGDEPAMLKNSLKDVPVVVDADRIRGAQKAVREHKADTVILDDGFQQWRIKKDLEIVTIDANSPFGNRNLLPRGILREPISSLKRADLLVLTKTDLGPSINQLKDYLRRVNPSAPIIESIHQPLGFCQLDKPEDLLDINMLQGKAVTIFSGIGDPDSFKSLIRNLGIKIDLTFEFPDHYNYTQEDLDKIIKDSKDKNIDTIITTEKDAARFTGLQMGSDALKILFLRIKLKVIKNEEELYNRLLGLYSF
ncbi:MAG: tetraacyldisaccharide 4'-kinase [Candidatus Omnitrophota bacterium]